MATQELNFLSTVEAGNIVEIQSYLSKAGNINVTNYVNESALTIATMKHYEAIVTLLLEQKEINLHLQGYITGTPLTFAIFENQIALIKLLIDKEDKFENSHHPGAISWAILNDSSEVLELLKEKGANFNLPGLQGYSEPPEWTQKPQPDPRYYPFNSDDFPFLSDIPICLAIRINNPGMLEYLLTKCNANPNTPNTDGKTPLQVACEKGRKEMVQTLLNHGAIPSLPETQSDDSYLPSFLRQRPIVIDPEIKEILAKAQSKNIGEAPNNVPMTTYAESIKKEFPLHSAALTNDNEKLRQLINSRQYNIDACDTKYQQTPLHKAALQGNKEAAQLLISNRAQTSIKDINGETPYQLAKRFNKIEVAIMIQDHNSSLIKDYAFKEEQKDNQSNIKATMAKIFQSNDFEKLKKDLKQAFTDNGVSIQSHSDLTLAVELYSELEKSLQDLDSHKAAPGIKPP